MIISCLDMEFETPKHPASYRTYVFVLLFVSTLALYMLYLQSYAQLNQSRILTSLEYPEHPASRYLLWSSKCKIPNVSPFNDDVKSLHSLKPYMPCRKLPLLSYITVSDNKATLHINSSAIRFYSKNGISCCYSVVTRARDKKEPDSTIKISPCTAFKDNATLPEDFVLVECQDNATQAQVYKNAHAAITISNEVQKKLEGNEKKRHLSILCIGIDSVSRLNLMRAMRKTHSFLEKNQWLEMRCYNKIADNTFPNLMAIFTGMNESSSYESCNPRKIGALDKCSMLLYDYRDHGYVTGYAEDEASINTFNYHKKGFLKSPTDYYFRPYILATEHNLKTSRVDEMTYCTGPETAGERILHLANDFAHTFKEQPYFGFFWMNTFSHNRLNAVSRMDGKVYEILESLWYGDVLNNTMVMFFSDHGLRFGDIRYTRTGWLEERLPFLYIYFPEWFKETYPQAYKTLETNSKRLTTPYDIFMTLQDLLIMTGSNHSVRASSACPKCHSLFTEVDVDRSCEDAAIEQHWCTCNGYVQISPNNSTVEAAAKYVLNQIHETVNSYGEDSRKCAKLLLKKVILSSISERDANWYKNDTYLLIIFETVPEAVFEATVSVEFSTPDVGFEMQGSISRLDYYQTHSNCVHDSILKKYCYCHR